jgi:hypothetical protein
MRGQERGTLQLCRRRRWLRSARNAKLRRQHLARVLWVHQHSPLQHADGICACAASACKACWRPHDTRCFQDPTGRRVPTRLREPQQAPRARQVLVRIKVAVQRRVCNGGWVRARTLPRAVQPQRHLHSQVRHAPRDADDGREARSDGRCGTLAPLSGKSPSQERRQACKNKLKQQAMWPHHLPRLWAAN